MEKWIWGGIQFVDPCIPAVTSKFFLGPSSSSSFNEEKTEHIVVLLGKKSHKIQTGSKEDVKIASLFKPSTLSAETGR